MKNTLHPLMKSLFATLLLTLTCGATVSAQDAATDATAASSANAATATATDTDTTADHEYIPKPSFSDTATAQVFNVFKAEMVKNTSAGMSKQFDVDRIAKFQISPEEEEKLKLLYGDVKPLRIDVKKQDDGSAVVRYELQPLNYMDPQTKSMTQWDAVTGVSTYSKDRKEMKTEWSWPAYYQTLGDQSWQMTGLKISGTSKLNAQGIPLGGSALSIAQVKVQDKSDIKTRLQLDDLQASYSSVQEGQMATLSMKFHIKSITVHTYIFTNFNYDFQIKNINLRALVGLMRELEKSQAAVLKDKKKSSTTLFKASPNKSEQLMKDMFFSSSSKLSDLSVEYKGMPLRVTGSLEFNSASSGKANKAKKSTATPTSFDLQMQLSTPRALALEIAKAVLAKQSPDDEDIAAPEDMDGQAQTRLQMLVYGGFLVEKDKEMLGSALQIRVPLGKTKGAPRIVLNGKDMSQFGGFMGR